MTSTSAMNPARLQVPSKHGAASRTGTDSGLLIAVGLVRFKGDCMGYNARNDEIHENLERMPGARSLRGLVSYRPPVQRAPIRGERHMVLADSGRRARIKASLARHRVRCLRHRHRHRSDREASRSRRTDPRCAQRHSLPALQRPRPDADHRPLAGSVSLRTRSRGLTDWSERPSWPAARVRLPCSITATKARRSSIRSILILRFGGRIYRISSGLSQSISVAMLRAACSRHAFRARGRENNAASSEMELRTWSMP